MREAGSDFDLTQTSSAVLRLIQASLAHAGSPSPAAIHLIMAGGYLLHVGNLLCPPDLRQRNLTDKQLDDIARSMSPTDAELFISMIGVIMWKCYETYKQGDSHG